jgi:hypothetical protein
MKKAVKNLKKRSAKMLMNNHALISQYALKNIQLQFNRLIGRFKTDMMKKYSVLKTF